LPAHDDDIQLGTQKAVFASDSARLLLSENNLADIDAIFSKRAQAAERHQGRCVQEAILADARGTPARVFIKMQWGRRRLWPRMTDLKTGQVFQSLPVREWHGIQRFQSLGFKVPERLAVFRDGLFSMRAAVIVREVPPPFSIDEMLRNGDWNQLTDFDQTLIIKEIFATLGTIYASGIGWRGISSRHFFPQRDEKGRWKVWLIDCEGVHPRGSAKAMGHGFRKLMRSMKESGASAKTLEQLGQQIEQSRTALGLKAA